ncbi:MAG: DUF2400 family protein, partial [Proteobacteria bacterium]|nr:DUF2400 family protein [Pseudomonadota bacterium]
IAKANGISKLKDYLARYQADPGQQANWKVAEAATEKLKRYCPEDPIRYDFALCHLSMSGHRLTRFQKENRYA